MEKERPKVGIGSLIVRDGKILIGKIIAGHGNNTYMIPGGHLEFGESLAEGAMRELKEETGIVATQLTFLHMINEPREESHYIHVNFLFENCPEEPTLTEPDKFSEWKWFDMNSLPENIFFGHKQFVPTYKSNLPFIDLARTD